MSCSVSPSMSGENARLILASKQKTVQPSAQSINLH
jgi:hypothetical protein